MILACANARALTLSVPPKDVMVQRQRLLK